MRKAISRKTDEDGCIAVSYADLDVVVYPVETMFMA
jgi:hypothetical protein